MSEVHTGITALAVAEAVETERKRCAKIARDHASNDTDWDTSYWNQACEGIALRIERVTDEQSE